MREAFIAIHGAVFLTNRFHGRLNLGRLLPQVAGEGDDADNAIVGLDRIQVVIGEIAGRFHDPGDARVRSDDGCARNCNCLSEPLGCQLGDIDENAEVICECDGLFAGGRETVVLTRLVTRVRPR